MVLALVVGVVVPPPLVLLREPGRGGAVTVPHGDPFPLLKAAAIHVLVVVKLCLLELAATVQKGRGRARKGPAATSWHHPASPSSYTHPVGVVVGGIERRCAKRWVRLHDIGSHELINKLPLLLLAEHTPAQPAPTPAARRMGPTGLIRRRATPRVRERVVKSFVPALIRTGTPAAAGWPLPTPTAPTGHGLEIRRVWALSAAR